MILFASVTRRKICNSCRRPHRIVWLMGYLKIKLQFLFLLKRCYIEENALKALRSAVRRCKFILSVFLVDPMNVNGSAIIVALVFEPHNSRIVAITSSYSFIFSKLNSLLSMRSYLWHCSWTLCDILFNRIYFIINLKRGYFRNYRCTRFIHFHSLSTNI